MKKTFAQFAAGKLAGQEIPPALSTITDLRVLCGYTSANAIEAAKEYASSRAEPEAKRLFNEWIAAE